MGLARSEQARAIREVADAVIASVERAEYDAAIGQLATGSTRPHSTRRGPLAAA